MSCMSCSSEVIRAFLRPEGRLMEVVEQSGTDLIVLARYMQVLSDAVCKKMSGKIIRLSTSTTRSCRPSKVRTPISKPSNTA